MYSVRRLTMAESKQRMTSSKLVYSLCSLLTHFLALTLVQPSMLYKDCVGKGNYTTNGTYQANLNYLLNSIYTNTDINYGFYNFSYGESPDTVYAIALCRPDITPGDCRDCVKNASDLLTTICHNFKEAVGGQDNCMVRYANRSIFRLMEEGPYFWVYDEKNVSDVVGFNRSRMNLLDKLRDQAAARDSPYKYANGQIDAPNFQTIYALVQCTPDLTESECRDCLYNASGLIPQCCQNRDGGRIIYPSCNFRYEISRFYVDFPPPSPPKGNKNIRRRTVIIISVTTVTAIILLIYMGFILKQKKRKEEVEGGEETEEYGIEEAESLQIDFETLRNATDNFNAANKLGEGGFGAVYKGMLPNGQAVAVKRLSKGSGQGELEFRNEVLLVAKLQHRNLVGLRGFCFDKDERLLVYEYFSNSSLNKFIFEPTKRAILNWGTRYKIIEGIARGLMYLHTDSRLRIIHRDVKASNILLDEGMNPKISDFGMARLFSVDQTRDVTNRRAGTLGYMAPEYVFRGHVSVKSDVFSFGVLVLEIVSGQERRNFSMVEEEEEEEDLLTYAWRNWNQGTGLNLVDPTMSGAKQSEMGRCIHIALLCVQRNEADRPTMAQVVTVLSSHSITLPMPLEPAFYTQSASHRARRAELKEHESKFSSNEVTVSDMYPR